MVPITRHAGYLRTLHKSAMLLPISVALPLEKNPLLKLLETVKLCLDNNFLSCFMTIVGGIIGFHYESIMDIQDECPLFLCYSRESGTGKGVCGRFYNY